MKQRCFENKNRKPQVLFGESKHNFYHSHFAFFVSEVSFSYSEKCIEFDELTKTYKHIHPYIPQPWQDPGYSITPGSSLQPFLSLPSRDTRSDFSHHRLVLPTSELQRDTISVFSRLFCSAFLEIHQCDCGHQCFILFYCWGVFHWIIYHNLFIRSSIIRHGLFLVWGQLQIKFSWAFVCKSS